MRYCMVKYYDSDELNNVIWTYVVEEENLPYTFSQDKNRYVYNYYPNLTLAVLYWAKIAVKWNLRLMKLEPKEDFVTQYAASNQDKQVYVYK